MNEHSMIFDCFRPEYRHRQVCLWWQHPNKVKSTATENRPRKEQRVAGMTRTASLPSASNAEANDAGKSDTRGKNATSAQTPPPRARLGPKTYMLTPCADKQGPGPVEQISQKSHTMNRHTLGDTHHPHEADPAPALRRRQRRRHAGLEAAAVHASVGPAPPVSDNLAGRLLRGQPFHIHGDVRTELFFVFV